jgi:hypothetical protein
MIQVDYTHRNTDPAMRLPVKIKASDHQIIRAAAIRAGIHVSTWVRAAMDEKLKREAAALLGVEGKK